MRINILSISSLVVLFLLSSYTLANETGIEVTGTAKESVMPDMATFSFSINGRGVGLTDLKNEIDIKSANTVSLCKRLGIKSKNISSSEVLIHPQYNFQTKSLLGYEVTRNINVVLDNLDKYTELVNGAIKSGVTTITNISLDIKDRAVLERRALGSALKVARKKAEILAISSGVGIGQVLYVKEGGGPIRLETYEFNQKASISNVATGVFEPGEISVTTTVTARYAIN